jgi:hypothetical protein
LFGLSGDVCHVSAGGNATREGPRDVSSVDANAKPKTERSQSINTLTSVGVVVVDDGPQDLENFFDLVVSQPKVTRLGADIVNSAAHGSEPTWLSPSDIQLLETGNPLNDKYHSDIALDSSQIF